MAGKGLIRVKFALGHGQTNCVVVRATKRCNSSLQRHAIQRHAIQLAVRRLGEGTH
jgi:hypothetical protein